MLTAACALLAIHTLPPLPLHAQSFFPDYVEQGIDSALSSIYMTRYDLGMRWDATGDDPHRFSEIKGLFSDPLRSFAIADSVALAGERSLDEPLLFFRAIRSLLDLSVNFPEPARINVRDREIGVVGRFDINSLNYTEQIVLRRFVALAIATDVMIEQYRAQIDSAIFNRLVSYADSLIIQSEEDAKEDLITMRYGEEYHLNRAKQFFNIDLLAVNFDKLLGPGVVMYAQALDYAVKMKPEVPSYYKDVRTSVWETPLGLIAIGGPGDDVYTGNFFCIIDIGGNDIYRGVQKSKQMALKQGATLIVDFSGNDTYVGEDYAFGGTLFGAATVIDLEGSDSYTAQNFSLGCGFFGVGILHDQAGSDRYSGGTATQGAGIFGLGLIVDGDGNDNYLAHIKSQGFGFTRGFGAIIEHGGNDQYVSSSPYQDFLRYDDHFESFCQGASLGARPVASGGYGFIADMKGNDMYFSDIYGQGTAYWYGLGGIVDRKGNDYYNSYQYAQGSGVHLAFGVLMDNEGKDNYISHGVSQGCGHDIAFGGLYDARGEDNYVVESLSLGGGNADAVSLFIDAGGNDGYLARVDNTLGYSDLRRDYGMVGLFLDLDGQDFYGTTRGGNDSLWVGSTYGSGLDARLRPEEHKLVEEKKPEKSREEIEKELETDIKKLFIQASAAPDRYQYLVEPARQRIVEWADSTIPYLLWKLNTEHPRESLALDVILTRIGTRLTPQLIDTIVKGDRSRVGTAIYILGRLRDSTAAVVIGKRLRDRDSWRIRSTAAEALMKMNATEAKPYLAEALDDTVDIVRARVARAFVRVANPSELATLLPLTNDPSQIVRYQIQLGLLDRGFADSTAREFLTTTLLNSREGYTYQILYPLAQNIQDPHTREQLMRGLIADTSPAVRADGVRLAIAWNDPKLLQLAANLRGREKNSQVLYQIYRAEDKLKEG